MRKLDRIPQTLGEKLRALRRGQAVTLDMLAKQTRIQKKYLYALERGLYDDLPDPIYTRQFVRMYVGALHADIKYFLELYDEECGRCNVSKPMQSPRQRIDASILMPWEYVWRYIIIGVICSGVFIYLFIQTLGVFLAPKLIIYTPQEMQLITSDSNVRVQGYVDTGGTVYINGKTISTDQEGVFDALIPLRRGVNDIVIEAQRKYSLKKKIEKTIIYQQEDVYKTKEVIQ